MAPERRIARQELVEHDTHRPDIGALIDVACGHHLFGRHVRWRADDLSQARYPRVARRFFPRGDAEVDHLHDGACARAGVSEKNVGWLHVAVDDAEGVGLRDTLASVGAPRERLPVGHATSGLDEAAEVRTFEVLEGEV